VFHRSKCALNPLAKHLFTVSLLTFGGFAIFATAAQAFGQTSTFKVQSARAYDFLNSEGVNTHFATDPPYYQQSAALIARIKALHIRHIRDGLAYYGAPPNLYAIHSQLASDGVSADLIVPYPTTAGPTPQSIEALLPNYPAVEAIEGPNEYDSVGNGQWVSALLNYLPSIWTVGQDRRVPVFGPSLTQISSYGALGNVSADISDGNYHAYWGGRNPETTGWGGPDASGNYYGSLPYDLDELAIDSPGRPVVITETGYFVNNTPSQNIIPESVEAIYEPRLFLHCWNMGIKRTYVYELMDNPPSMTFGLLRYDLSPRPAYTALSTLNSLLADSSASFTPQTLTYSLSGNTDGLETTLLQKHDGSFWLAIWENAAIYDVNAVAPIAVSPATVTLSVPQGLLIKGVWTLNSAGTATSVTVNTNAVKLSIQPAVTLVKISK